MCVRFSKVTFKIKKDIKIKSRRALWQLVVTGDREWAEGVVEDFKIKHGFEQE
jgi:hypothetical protein